MKRLIALILSAMLLLLAGCSDKTAKEPEKETTPVVPSSYSADLHINFNDKIIEGKYIQQSLGNIEIKFTSPRAIKGVSIKYEGTECTFGYAGLTLSTDLSKLPETNVGKMMIESFKKASGDSAITKEKVEDKWIYKGTNNEKEFTITQDAKTGFFEKIEMPFYKFTAELTNFVTEK